MEGGPDIFTGFFWPVLDFGFDAFKKNVAPSNCGSHQDNTRDHHASAFVDI